MRKITNIKLPQPSKNEEENNLFSLVLDEYGNILALDKSSKKKSISLREFRCEKVITAT